MAQAPLRVSFLGGGTDFREHFGLWGGEVLSAALTQAVYVIVQRRFDDKVCAHYTQRELVESVDDIQHDLIRETLRLTGVKSGVEVTTLADVPAGTGLGSSSSITTALLVALHAYQGEALPARELAQEACRIEIDTLRRPIGVQDQYIAAYGGVRWFSFRSSYVCAEPLNFPSRTLRRLESRLMLFYTGKAREASEVLEGQCRRQRDNTDTLNEMAKQARRGVALIRDDNLDAFGRLLHEAWELKRTLAPGIATPIIDAMYNAAREAGALGGKVTGAGGGGFLLLYARPEEQPRVRQALAAFREMPVKFDPQGARVIFDYRRD